jgi:hypothetical protein
LTLKPRGAFRDFHEALAADWRESRHEVGFAGLTNEGLPIVGPNVRAKPRAEESGVSLVRDDAS